MDETKLTEFVEKAVGDVGALLGGARWSSATSSGSIARWQAPDR